MGAPNAETGQPGVERPGAVYKCPPDSPGDCDIIPFDKEGECFSASKRWPSRVTFSSASSRMSKFSGRRLKTEGTELATRTSQSLGERTRKKTSFLRV